MIQTAIWIPPSLCGCQIQMTAEFIDGSVINGVSYKHPKPFTITNIQIVSVCPTHLVQTLSMIDTSKFMEIDPYTNVSFQQRGYLKYPIATPTSAECLYTFLCQYGGQTHSYPCGCRAHQWVDEGKNVTNLVHSLVTKKCFQHKLDDIHMTKAGVDFKVAMAAASSTG